MPLSLLDANLRNVINNIVKSSDCFTLEISGMLWNLLRERDGCNK